MCRIHIQPDSEKKLWFCMLHVAHLCEHVGVMLHLSYILLNFRMKVLLNRIKHPQIQFQICASYPEPGEANFSASCFLTAICLVPFEFHVVCHML
ncbi:unnamed protein product [Heterobilharzia americana]|nr:unnamed protein product [Heterobilharzia americana]